MTSYTRNYRLPHPTATLLPSGVERFNDDARGGRDEQDLAEAMDRQLDRVNGLWVAQLAKPGEVIKLATDITGLPQNTDNAVLFDTSVDTSGGMTDTQIITANSQALAGWHHVHVCVSSIPSGASSGVRRLLKAWVREDTSAGIITAEEYLQEEFESGGQTTNELSFVTYLGPTRDVNFAFFHNNPSSTLTIKNTATFASTYRIAART